MKTFTLLATALLGLSAALPAHAASIQFFEGNNCTQSPLEGFNTDRYIFNVNLTSGTLGARIVNGGWNDEARSVRILSHWRTKRDLRRFVLEVYDHPKGRDHDDWARIIVRDARLIPPEGVCIGSFERAFNRNGVAIERHPNNGLDGKVSRVVLVCDAACKSDLTP